MSMGQALEMCVHCENKRGCDTCTDLHNWIMEHLEPKQEWISVKDRLPEAEERVLVYSYEDGINFGYFLGYEDGFFIDCVYPNESTHWMPLPEPPKEE